MASGWATMRRLTVLRASAAMALTLLLADFAGLASPTWAGPPLVTDDPETPGRRGWEVNVSHSIVQTKNERLMESPLIDINYGLLENDQWKIEFPVLFVDPEDKQSHWGVGDLLLGWKYRFLEEDEHGVMASVYPQPLVPTGNHSVGLSGGRFELLLPVEVGKHFCDERLFVYAEAGYNVVFGNSAADQWIYGVAAQWQASEHLELIFEVGGASFPSGVSPDDTFFNGGFNFAVTENVAFIAAMGRSLLERDHGTPDLMTFLGFQFTTGGGTGRIESRRGLTSPVVPAPRGTVPDPPFLVSRHSGRYTRPIGDHSR